MELFIKQRVFSWGQNFDVFDAGGRVVYSCKGEIFTFGRKLHVSDSSGREVIYIKQKLFKLMPHYEIYINGRFAATLIKEFSFLKHNFRYEGVDWRVEGDFLAHDYRIMNYDQEVMTISKRWFAWGDTYDLSLNEKFNPLLALASVIVIDCVCHEE